MNTINTYARNGWYHEGIGSFHYKNDEMHREGGPAAIFKNGTIKYLVNGQYHREDGPAIIWHTGEEDYFLNDEGLTKQKFVEQKLKNLLEW